jgi:radical SAM protein with 4Fe4S-binding SPASM domain
MVQPIDAREEYLIRRFGELYAHSVPNFYQIQIETCSFCNETCGFCPANAKDDIRGKKFMPQSVLDKIFNDLREIDFGGIVSLYNNNEPLIDKRLEDIIQQSKKMIPKAKTLVISNGKLLTFKRFESLHLSGLDSLVIDNYYTDKRALNKPVADFVEEFKHSSYAKTVNVKIYLRYKYDVLDSRGGNSPNKKAINPELPLKKFCVYPFMQFNVNYKGEVNLCCNDVYYENVMGDVTQNSVREIWSSVGYQNVRRKLMKKDRNHGICAKCDTNNKLCGSINLVGNELSIPDYYQKTIV